jgi:predicted ATPase
MEQCKISSFKIESLFNQYDVDLPFNQNVNIFIGENGMGKTTILNCINYVLSGKMEKLYSITFSKITVTFCDTSILSIEHDDLAAYMDDIMYDNKRKYIKYDNFEKIFSDKEIYELKSTFNENKEIDLNKYSIRISDMYGMSPNMAKHEMERYIISLNRKKKGDFQRVIQFKKAIQEKITDEILYFPTYRRIEEEMTNLGIDIEKDRIKNRLIQFGMSDVEITISRLLETIKSAAINGFTKMTGVLLKQYLDGAIIQSDDNPIDMVKLGIALGRIGDEIEKADKERIKELVNSEEIYDPSNYYLLTLIKNLINSYEKQNQYDERVKSFVNVCNGYLNGKKYIYDESNVELGIFRETAKSPISIQNLSSGEKQVISIFAKLYLEKQENCIILFDEPELSLSIKWQAHFLPDIMKSKKCNLLIAVTHSPFIFDNEYDDLAKDMGTCLTQSN